MTPEQIADFVKLRKDMDSLKGQIRGLTAKCERLDKAEADLARLRDVLESIRQWDMINPSLGQPHPLSDGPWLRRLVNDALAPGEP